MCGSGLAASFVSQALYQNYLSLSSVGWQGILYLSIISLLVWVPDGKLVLTYYDYDRRTIYPKRQREQSSRILQLPLLEAVVVVTDTLLLLLLPGLDIRSTIKNTKKTNDSSLMLAASTLWHGNCQHVTYTYSEK